MHAHGNPCSAPVPQGEFRGVIRNHQQPVMRGVGPGISIGQCLVKGDGRGKPGHDEGEVMEKDESWLTLRSHAGGSRCLLENLTEFLLVVLGK